MDTKDFMEMVERREPIIGGTEAHKMLVKHSNDALRITSKLNGRYHKPAEVRKLFSLLIGKEVDDSFFIFPPFYSDFGKNIAVGKNVWICANATVVPGVVIGDNAIIAAGAVVTKEVAPNTIVAGVPAQTVNTIEVSNV